MNIFQKAARAFGSVFGKTYIEPGWQPLLELVESEEHFKHRPLIANEQVSWVYACIRRIAMSVMSANLRLYQTNTEGEWKEIDSHPILDLLHEPNPFLSKNEFFFLLAQFIELTGESNWWKIRDEFGRFVGLSPLNPLKMELKLENNWPSHWIYRTTDEKGVLRQIRLEMRDVMQVKLPNPRRPFRGLSPISAAAPSIDSYFYSATWSRRFFKNSAVPSAAIVSEKPLSQTQYERLRAEIDTKYRGMSNAHKVLLLENNVKFQPITMSMKDMQLLELKKFNREEIAAIFGVPLAKLGIVEDVNRASAEQLDITYSKETITPLLRMIEETLTRSLLKSEGTSNLVFSFDSVVPKNTMVETAKHTAYLDRSVLTINEVRKELGLPPVEWGDKPFKKNEEPAKTEPKKVMT